MKYVFYARTVTFHPECSLSTPSESVMRRIFQPGLASGAIHVQLPSQLRTGIVL